MKSGTKKSLFYFVLMNKIKDIQQMDISKTNSCKIIGTGYIYMYRFRLISIQIYTEVNHSIIRKYTN